MLYEALKTNCSINSDTVLAADSVKSEAENLVNHYILSHEVIAARNRIWRISFGREGCGNSHRERAEGATVASATVTGTTPLFYAAFGK